MQSTRYCVVPNGHVVWADDHRFPEKLACKRLGGEKRISAGFESYGGCEVSPDAVPANEETFGQVDVE